MSGKSNPARRDEESRYLALLNALTEINHGMVKLDAPISARDMLAQLIGLCRSDFSRRFG
jgi:hypothetical protein